MEKLSKKELRWLKGFYKTSLNCGFFKGTFEEYLEEIPEENLKELLFEINNN